MELSVAKSMEVMRYPLDRCCHHAVISLVFLLTVSLTSLASPVDAERQWIRLAMTQEPPNLNSMRSTDLVSYFLLGHINEGLLRYDRRGRLIPGVAESWQVEADRITFKLRADARWSDGTAVTAHDFVFTWRKVNDPVEAAPFAAIMYPIRNAEAVQRGELPLSELGVYAIDDRTLVMELERPCGYCLSLMPHGTFFPVKASFYEEQGARYGSEATHLLANGPFVLSEWVHESRLTLKKNPNYWNSEAIQLNEIEIAYITSDNRTRLNLFRDGQIAFARLGSETVKDAVDQGMRLRTFLSGGIAYVWFNMREGRATTNLALRRAVQAAFDANEYVNQVVAIPGYKPTTTLFPSWLKGTDGRFVDEYPPPDFEQGTRQVNALMAQAQLELGEIPPLTILTVSSPTGAKVAEYFQGMLKQSLGIEALVDQQSFKQYLNKSRQGDFDLGLSSWYPDFDDLVTYADLLGSYNANNRGRFVNREYDEWLEVLQRSVDPKERFGAAAEMQRIIVEQVPVLPTAETGSAYLVHPKLKGMIRRVIGQDPDFTYARVVGSE
ncbi:MAG: peptide ABC transporter substrate-binding protein [Gammaproteobacteria bacterium]|nr:peptide ABC transporter substrate-binding protein [Gammaproteobacteria bacterium]MBT4494356.1 peptide ABC transporter substrate-binding protein [Gammaproteobacteria bacterium]MBT7371153.1 peptide ABC transporter substrate-binding protein [Gammaproteobacteria bacterium]